jgi:PIN domain nuclease of toxin-antitoxin system
MRLLLDTHVYLWVVSDSARLKREARRLIAAADAVYVSSASIWEIAIKTRLGKIKADPAALADAIAATGCIELPISSRHAAAVAALPDHHGDPFDRMLIAQARVEPLRLLTADALLARYGDHVEVIA